MRPTGLAALCFGIIACNSSEGGNSARVDASQLYSSPGEVALSDGGGPEFSITSDRYKKWLAAQEGLDRRIASRYGALLQPASPSERSIDRAVAYLEGEPRARHAIQRAGMSVRDFVITTVALEQEMRVASRSETPPMDTMAMAYPYPTDSVPAPPYPAPAPYPAYPSPYPVVPPAYPLPPRRVDSMPRVDTVFVVPPSRDTNIPRRDSLFPRRDSVLISRDTFLPRRDTLLPGRDTIAPRRDTLLLPTPKRDSVRRDTLLTPPPISFRRP